MELQELQDIVIQAWTGNKLLKLTEYRRDSTGKVSNLVIRLGGASGYRDAVKEQLQEANYHITMDRMSKLRQYDVSVELYNKVVTETLAKWRDIKDHDTMAVSDTAKNLAKMLKGLEPHESGAFWTSKLFPLVLIHSFRLSEEIVIPGKPEDPYSSSKKEVLAKNIFAQGTFIRDYIPRIHLSTESHKVRSVSIPNEF